MTFYIGITNGIIKYNESQQIDVEMIINEVKKINYSTNFNKEEKSKTYSKYIDEAGDYYSVVVKIDKTYLYVRAADKYKSEINTVLKELGY